MRTVPNCIVTTAYRTNSTLEEEAAKRAASFAVPFIERRKKSIAYLHKTFQRDVFVVSKERDEWYPVGQITPIFFHPNSAMFRAKRILRGERDPLIEAGGIEKGMSVLDATLGVGSDAIITSLVTGEEGSVIGVEGNPLLAHIVRNGLQLYREGPLEVQSAMKRIRVENNDHVTFLQQQPRNAVDVVYFDPMFEVGIEESHGLNAIRTIAYQEDTFHTAIEEAKRVARKRVVVKDHYQSARFEKYSFEVLRRKTSLFHFGYISVT